MTTAAHARDLGLGQVKGFTGPYYALWSRLDKTYIAIATTPKNCNTCRGEPQKTCPQFLATPIQGCVRVPLSETDMEIPIQAASITTVDLYGTFSLVSHASLKGGERGSP